MNPIPMETFQRMLILGLWIGGTYYCAHRKGYTPFYFLIGGLASLLVLAFLPFTSNQTPASPADIRRRVWGNRIGMACSLISGVVTMPLLMMR